MPKNCWCYQQHFTDHHDRFDPGLELFTIENTVICAVKHDIVLILFASHTKEEYNLLGMNRHCSLAKNEQIELICHLQTCFIKYSLYLFDRKKQHSKQSCSQRW